MYFGDICTVDNSIFGAVGPCMTINESHLPEKNVIKSHGAYGHYYYQQYLILQYFGVSSSSFLSNSHHELTISVLSVGVVI